MRLFRKTTTISPARKRSSFRNSRGISLVEVCASVAVFGLMVSGLTGSTIGVIRANSSSRFSVVAGALIQESVERFRAVDPASEPADFAHGTHEDPSNPIDGYGENGGPFTRKWTVTRNTPHRGVAQIEIEISWMDPQPRKMTAVTFVCQTDTCT